MTEVPSASYGGYYRLKEVIEKKIFPAKKVIFEFKDNFVYVDGKVIQGLKVTDSNVYIKCIHYTAWENATQIRSMRRIEPSLEDPFVYLAPRGVMQDWPEAAICKELGSKSADTEVWLELAVPVDRVWLKASRSVVHFAVESILSENDILELSIQRRKQS